MELCEVCHENESVIHITQMSGDGVAMRHLCEECAVEEGIPLPNMGDEFGEMDDDALEKEVIICSRCGTSDEEFRKDYKAGCARCYDVFASELENRMRVKSGHRFYTGKQYNRAGSRAFKSELDCLREELSATIRDQKFEVASVLRDRIRVLEEQLDSY
jgi:protein arginine kinase activator